jgi:uncharacterized protein DUF4031
MTVYVDNMLRPARVGRIHSRWSHLLADTHTELMAFAEQLGLRPEWLQHPGSYREHFDLTPGRGPQVEHDYRPFDALLNGTQGPVTTVLRCVWCHAVACGNYGDPDPCIEPWHHEPLPHRTKAGRTWPIGGTLDEENHHG